MASLAHVHEPTPANPVEASGFAGAGVEQPVFREQRKDRRHITILRVALMRVDKRSELCLIRNISAGGLMAHVYSDVVVGQKLQFEFRDGTEVSGEVRWRRGEAVGIAFEAPINIEHILASSPLTRDGKQPRAPRIEVSCDAVLRRQDGSVSVAQLQDISQGGVKLTSPQIFTVGEHVVLNIPEFGSVAGSICWQIGTAKGVSFVRPTPYTKLAQWLKLHFAK